MIEAYKIILKESGSVRRAEDLSRRMKARSQQGPKPKTRDYNMHVVSEEIDRMQDNMLRNLRDNGEADDSRRTQVKLIRSRSQTKLLFVFKGNVEETEEKLHKIYKTLVSGE
jgi:hypothetical protein